MEPYVYHSSQHEYDGVRVTVVGKIDNGLLFISAARCSKEDPFVKKTGRSIAIGRLDESNFITAIDFPALDQKKFISAAKAVADSVVKHGVSKRITLINNSKLFIKSWWDSDFVNPDIDYSEFSYILL